MNAAPFRLHLRAGNRAPATIHAYLDAVDRLDAFRAERYSKADDTLEQSWGGVGVVAAEWQDEMLDPGDQGENS